MKYHALFVIFEKKHWKLLSAANYRLALKVKTFLNASFFQMVTFGANLIF